jgi:hypothetical protein
VTAYDPAALFGPAEGAADAAPEDAEFDAAFDDFVAAFEAGDTEAARIAFKDAVKACYASESVPAEDPLADLPI